MDSVGWFGLYLPAGAPPEIAKRLSTDVAEVVQSADAKARLEAMGVIPVGSTPAQLTATMRADHERWREVIQAKNIRLE